MAPKPSPKAKKQNVKHSEPSASSIVAKSAQPSNYQEVQDDELEVLKAIYADAYEDVDAKTAWSKATDRSFKLKLSAHSDVLVYVVLFVTLTATYPKTLPLLKLGENAGISQAVLRRVEDVVATKPQELLGGEMIYDLATTIQDLLEDAATVLAEKEAQKAQLPSLEEERAVREAAAAKIEQESRMMAIRQEEEAKAKEQEQLDREFAEMEKRQQSTKSITSNMPIRASTLSSSATVTFDRDIERLDTAGTTSTFRTVVLTAVTRRDPALSEYEASPVTDDIAGSVYLLKRISIEGIDAKQNLVSIEKSLERLKALRNPNIVEMIDFRLVQNASTGHFDCLFERPSQGSLAALLDISDLLPTARARVFGLQILEGLDYLHRQGIMHGTLNASNVKLALSSDGSIAIKLANADVDRQIMNLHPKLRDSSKSTPSLSAWPAPERELSSSDKVSRDSDIWDFGVIFVQMLVGLRTCERYTTPSTFLKSVSLSDPFEDLVDDVFRRQPKERPSASDLIRYEYFRVDVPALHSQASSAERSGSMHAINNTPKRRLRKESSTAITTSTSRYVSEWDELGRLGKGGFGEVVKARNKVDGRISAIKKIMHKTPAELNAVLSEVHLLAQLNHPNVVRYFGAWPEDEADVSEP